MAGCSDKHQPATPRSTGVPADPKPKQKCNYTSPLVTFAWQLAGVTLMLTLLVVST